MPSLDVRLPYGYSLKILLSLVLLLEGNIWLVEEVEKTQGCESCDLQ